MGKVTRSFHVPVGVHAVPKLWPQSTMVCVASGPSLTAEDVETCRDRARMIVINNNYQLAPWADVLYAADAKWWDWHQGVPSFAGFKYSLMADARKWSGVKVLQNAGSKGLELKPTGLRTGRNSGYHAINLAVHLGAARILLLGYDMKTGPKGEQHWHEDHPRKTVPPFTSFLECFKSLVGPLHSLGIEIVNCSRTTALTCFPRKALTDVLPDRLEVAS